MVSTEDSDLTSFLQAIRQGQEESEQCLGRPAEEVFLAMSEKFGLLPEPKSP